MRVEIGPVSGRSAAVWLDYGRKVVEHVSSMAAPAVSDGSLGRFSALLDQWDPQVEQGDGDFRWAADMSPEEVEFIMKGLYEVGLVVEAESAAGRLGLRPPEADEFHYVVVRQVLAQIESLGPANAQFVEGLRADWRVAGEE